MDGWIKAHRKLLDWEWFSDGNTFHVFMYLLLSANRETKKWRGIEILPGQHITSRDTISTKTKLSIQQVRTALKKLKSTNEITIESTNKYTIITLVNWGLYQGSSNNGNQQPNQQITNEQPTNNQQITTNKKEKKYKNQEKEKKEDTAVDNATISTDITKEVAVVKTLSGKPDSGIHAAIINHLNISCGTKFKANTKATKEHINARLKEGFTLNDFIEVINKKVFEWGNNPNMVAFLRPQTLFGTKFESYLNQPWTNGARASPTDMALAQFVADGDIIDSGIVPHCGKYPGGEYIDTT